jgi:hypothetical protein
MAKRLQVDYVRVRDVNFGEETSLRDGVLTINKEEALKVVQSDLFGSVDLKIAKPGDDTRILGVHDVMQPRCKADHPEESYPGMWGKLAPAGEGRTVALKGVVISDIYYAKCNIKYYMDMGGECAKYSNFTRHINICLDATVGEGVSDLSYTIALKQASLSLNVWLAKLAIGLKPDETKVFENKPVDPERHLPRVAYVVTQMASNDSWNFFYYGQSAINFLPIVVQPTEILDGAMIWRYWEPNYYLQEECYIEELLERNGKDLDFAGVIFANNVMKITGKDAMSMIAATLAKETLGADCVMVNKSGMGHCQLDSTFVFNWCQKLGMPAAVNFSAVSNDEPGDMLVVSDPKVDAVVNSGRNWTLHHPRVKTLIGEGTNVPCLINVDPWGPFDHTTNFCYQGVWSQLGQNYFTTDADIKRPGEGE